MYGKKYEQLSEKIYFDDYDSSDDELLIDSRQYLADKEPIKDLKTHDINNNRTFDFILKESDELLELKHAIIHDNVDKIVKLIDNININTRFSNGWTCLLYAISNCSLELCKLFIDKGADVNYSIDKQNTLMFACSTYSSNQLYLLEIVKLLINNGSSVNTFNRQLQTPLMLASKSGNYLIVQYLIDSNAYINCRDDNGFTVTYNYSLCLLLLKCILN
jgi:ankyrin repeat protein